MFAKQGFSFLDNLLWPLGVLATDQGYLVGNVKFCR